MVEFITENVARAFLWYDDKGQENAALHVEPMRRAFSGETADTYGVRDFWRVYEIVKATAMRANCDIKLTLHEGAVNGAPKDGDNEIEFYGASTPLLFSLYTNISFSLSSFI